MRINKPKEFFNIMNLFGKEAAIDYINITEEGEISVIDEMR